jgi:hypothetical protein
MSEVRPRPLSHIKYFYLCKNTSPCWRGDACPFAHSRAEQKFWNSEQVSNRGAAPPQRTLGDFLSRPRVLARKSGGAGVDKAEDDGGGGNASPSEPPQLATGKHQHRLSGPSKPFAWPAPPGSARAQSLPPIRVSRSPVTFSRHLSAPAPESKVSTTCCTRKQLLCCCCCVAFCLCDLQCRSWE